MSICRNMRRISANIGLVCLATVGCLFVLELVIRAWHVVPVNDYRPIFNRSASYQMQPHSSMVEVQPEFATTIAINGAGFRDKEFSMAKRRGWTRIALIGDSFTFGTGVSQTERASDYLERILLEDGLNCEVYNFGIPDTETLVHVAVLRDTILAYEPDYVLLMLYIGNDVVDNMKVAGGRGKAYGPPGSVGYALIDQIRMRSQLYQFVLMRMAAIPPLQQWYNEIKTTRRWGEVGEQMEIFSRSSEHDEGLWEGTFDALRQFVSVAEAHNVHSVVVLVPARLQYDTKLWEKLLRAQNLDGKAFRLTQPNDVLSKFVSETLHAEVLDPLAEFQEAQSQGAEVYYPINGHLTSGGHQILARHIAKYFQGRLARSLE